MLILASTDEVENVITSIDIVVEIGFEVKTQSGLKLVAIDILIQHNPPRN